MLNMKIICIVKLQLPANFKNNFFYDNGLMAKVYSLRI